MLQAAAYSDADNIYQWAPDNGLMDPMDAPDLSTVGGRVVYMRRLRGLSGAELASRAKCAQPSLWALEKNRTKEPAAWLIASVARALETSWEFVLQGPDPAKGIDVAVAEAEIVALFRELSGPARFSLLEFARHLKSSAPQDTNTGVSTQQADADAYKRATTAPRTAKKASRKSGS